MIAAPVKFAVALCCLLMSVMMPTAYADEARQKVPWLDLPASWIGTVENGVAAYSPTICRFWNHWC